MKNEFWFEHPNLKVFLSVDRGWKMNSGLNIQIWTVFLSVDRGWKMKSCSDPVHEELSKALIPVKNHPGLEWLAAWSRCWSRVSWRFHVGSLRTPPVGRGFFFCVFFCLRKSPVTSVRTINMMIEDTQQMKMKKSLFLQNVWKQRTARYACLSPQIYIVCVARCGIMSCTTSHHTNCSKQSLPSEWIETKHCTLRTSFTSDLLGVCGMVGYRTSRVKAYVGRDM